MNTSIPSIADNSSFSPDSKVWVYVSNRLLSEAEAAQAQQYLDQFCRQWTAHNQALKATAEVFERQFVILMVDETQAGASGCSIDKSVHFLENLGDNLGVDFFERMRFAWINEQAQMQFANRAELTQSVQNAAIQDNTLMVNTLVQSKQDLQHKWLIPFHQSWHKRL